jgi:peptidoglycan/LPS O-acetylase OafA/YrhL
MASARWSALDGLRALAVLGVMLYHAGVTWVPGGLLGVDVFFVLSGYLITSLLLREVRGGGRISFGRFWARRARRLLPALVLVLLAVAVWVALDPKQNLRSVRLDISSALLYVANWRFAFSGQGYFSATQSPSPVLHLWSLGVEEQFYLVWPLLVAGAVGVARFVPRLRAGSGRPAVFVLALLGTAASSSWLIFEALRGVDASRLYYGTDTRALALLTGAVLAAVLPLPRSPEQMPQTVLSTRRWSLVGALALGGLIAIIAIVKGEDRLLYRGGFLVVAVIVAVLIAALIRAPRGPISWLLGLPPLAHIGRISYGLYLWHWPVILFATAERTHLHGGELLAFRLIAALTLAEVSYWLLERPVLAGAFSGRRLSVAALVCIVGGVTVVGPWAVLPQAGDDNSRPASFSSAKLDDLARKQADLSQALTRRRVTPLPSPSPSPPPTPVPTQTPSPAPTAPSGPAPTLPNNQPVIPLNPVPAEPLNVLVVGDSTAWTAALALEDQAPAWKVNLTDGARVGCGIAPGIGAGDGDQAPVKYGECWNWPQLWAQTVAVQRPDVSLLVVGHWETVNRNVNGKVMHIGQPAYDKLLKAELERSVSVLSSAGGKVALATAPCYQRPERPNGTYWPQDNCRRSQAFNTLIWQVAAEHAATVVVLDLYNFFSPDGKWHLDIGGHQVRDVDGIHFNVDGGQWLAPEFLGGLRMLMGLSLFPMPAPKVSLNAETGG